MTSKILPQLILKTLKEFRNVLYINNDTKNADNTRTANGIGCNAYKCQHPKSETNKTNAKRTLGILPITLNILPFVFAVDCKPEKPPPMRYSELPIYNSPHANYKENQENPNKCRKYKQKKGHKMLQPYITYYRCCITNVFEKMFNWTECQVRINYDACKLSMDKFLSYMRDDKNIELRKTVVAIGSAAGFVFGPKNYNLLRNISFGVLAALFTGWLCFPEETDILLRNVAYYVATNVVYYINYAYSSEKYDIKVEKRRPLLPLLENLCKPTKPPQGNNCMGVYSRHQFKRQTEEDSIKLKEKVKAILEEQERKVKKDDDNANGSICFGK